MNKTLASVKEFHQTFGAPVLDSPQIPEDKRVKLRLTLILEELFELAEASGARQMFVDMMRKKVEEHVPQTETKDPAEALDALCDLLVVLNGSTLEYGLQDQFDEAFDEVHRSNMSKACETEGEGQATIQKYKAEGVETTLEKINGKYVIYRASDHKILKGVNFFTPDMQKYVEQS